MRNVPAGAAENNDPIVLLGSFARRESKAGYNTQAGCLDSVTRLEQLFSRWKMVLMCIVAVKLTNNPTPSVAACSKVMLSGFLKESFSSMRCCYSTS